MEILTNVKVRPHLPVRPAILTTVLLNCVRAVLFAIMVSLTHQLTNVDCLLILCVHPITRLSRKINALKTLFAHLVPLFLRRLTSAQLMRFTTARLNILILLQRGSVKPIQYARQELMILIKTPAMKETTPVPTDLNIPA